MILDVKNQCIIQAVLLCAVAGLSRDYLQMRLQLCYERGV